MIVIIFLTIISLSLSLSSFLHYCRISNITNEKKKVKRKETICVSERRCEFPPSTARGLSKDQGKQSVSYRLHRVKAPVFFFSLFPFSFLSFSLFVYFFLVTCQFDYLFIYYFFLSMIHLFDEEEETKMDKT